MALNLKSISIVQTGKLGAKKVGRKGKNIGEVIARQNVGEVDFIKKAAPGEKDPVIAIQTAFEANQEKTLLYLLRDLKLNPNSIGRLLGVAKESMDDLKANCAAIKGYERQRVAMRHIGDAIPENMVIEYQDNDGETQERDIAGKVLKAAVIGLYNPNLTPRFKKEPDYKNLDDKGEPTEKEIVDADTGEKILCHPVRVSIQKGQALNSSLEEILGKSTDEITRLQQQIRREFSGMFPTRERQASLTEAGPKLRQVSLKK